MPAARTSNVELEMVPSRFGHLWDNYPGRLSEIGTLFAFVRVVACRGISIEGHNSTHP